jgi:hypothetical protein
VLSRFRALVAPLLLLLLLLLLCCCSLQILKRLLPQLLPLLLRAYAAAVVRPH